MNNPYYSQQNPQQSYENNRSGRWENDENRGANTWREDNFNRGQNRSGQQYGQQSNYDDYGYQRSEFDRQRGQWGQEYSPYSGQGEPEYQPNITPRQYQSPRAENQRWGQGQSREWQQPRQGRSQSYAGSQVGNQFANNQFGGNQSTFGNQAEWAEQNASLGNNTYGAGDIYGGQQWGTQYGGDRGYGRSSFQSSGGPATGAYGLQQNTPQQNTHRGKGPKGYTRTDERIREEICELLSDDFSIDASEITVQVKEGIVTLEGTVQDRTQKHRAEDLVDNVSGVKDVHNGLRVTREASGPQASSQQDGTDKSQEKSANKSH